MVAKAKLMFLGYPNNPTGAIAPEGFFEQVVAFAHENDILVVHDNAYSEIVFDGYSAPSFLATPGAKDVGVEVFSLSKGYNMTGWRCAAVVGNSEALHTFWQLKTNIDSGMFEAVQLAGIAALSPDADAEVASMNELYRRRRDLVCEALRKIGVHVRPPHSTIYVWAPVPEGFASSADYCEHVLERTGVVLTPGAAYGPAGEGWFRISLTTPDERLIEAVERLGALGVLDLDWRYASDSATRAPTRLLHRGAARRRRPVGAGRAAAHGGRGGGGGDGPTARAAASQQLPGPWQGGRGEGRGEGVRREPDRLRR